MSKQIDRARARHHELVKAYDRMMLKADKLLDELMRVRGKIPAQRRRITASGKRIDKLVAAATHTNGPTASAAPELIEQVKEIETPKLASDPVPAFKAPRARKAKRTEDDFRAEMAAKKKAAGTKPTA